MRSPEDRVVRPTLRCLIEDLGHEVEPDVLRRVLPAARRDLAADPRFLFPVALAATEHLVLEKANMLALDPNAEREPIKMLAGRSTVKVKTSDRRGVLWQDDEGTWWLLAAGRRKGDGPGDFYRELERLASDSDPIAPTEDDYRYLRYERAYIGECEAERDAQVSVVGALLEAVAHPSTPSRVEVFGAAVTIVVEPENDGESEMLSMAFDFTTFEERDRFPVDILGFVPGYESVDAWDILPPLRSGDPECWFTYVSARWVEWLSTAVELDELLGAGGVASSPTSSVNGRLAHLAPASVVTLAYVEGIEITALCGARFAPCRNPENFEICPACAEALALLRTDASERPMQ
jgi:hypothetical protein